MTKRQLDGPAYSHSGRDVFEIPDNLAPTGTRCIQLIIPNDNQYEAQLFGALQYLTKWNSFKRDSAHNAIVVADLWKQIIESYGRCEDMSCCPLRIGPNGIEQQDPNTGLWTPVSNNGTGDPRTQGTVTPPWTHPPAGQTGNCLAGANIVSAMMSLVSQVEYNQTIAGGVLTLFGALSIFFAAAFPVVGAAVDACLFFAGVMVAATAIEYNATFQGPHTDEVNHKLQCIVACTVAADGHVTADNITDMKRIFGSYLPGPLDSDQADLYRNVWNGFLDTAGPNGLTRFAGIAGVTSANCDDCDCGWTSTLDFINVGSYASLLDMINGAYSSGVGWVGGYQDIHTRSEVYFHPDMAIDELSYFEVTYSCTAGGSGENQRVYLYVNSNALHNTDTLRATESFTFGLNVFGPVTDIYVDLNTGDSGGPVIMTKLKFVGTGLKPSFLP